MAENPFNKTSRGEVGKPMPLGSEEYKFLLGLIAESTFQGKEVLVVADIVNKIKSHVESIERGGIPPAPGARQFQRKG